MNFKEEPYKFLSNMHLCPVLLDGVRKWLEQGAMKGKSLVYYKNLGEPSHAHALEWLIDNWEEACILIDFSSLARRWRLALLP